MSQRRSRESDAHRLDITDVVRPYLNELVQLNRMIASQLIDSAEELAESKQESEALSLEDTLKQLLTQKSRLDQIDRLYTRNCAVNKTVSNVLMLCV